LSVRDGSFRTPPVTVPVGHGWGTTVGYAIIESPRHPV
jgi:hypothetical protein